MKEARNRQLNRAIGMLREVSFELRVLPFDLAEETEPVLKRALSGMRAAIKALEKESNNPAGGSAEPSEIQHAIREPNDDQREFFRTGTTPREWVAMLPHDDKETKGDDTCQ